MKIEDVSQRFPIHQTSLKFGMNGFIRTILAHLKHV